MLLQKTGRLTVELWDYAGYLYEGRTDSERQENHTRSGDLPDVAKDERAARNVHALVHVIFH